MISSVITASLCGLDAEIVRVETDITQGLPYLALVGLPAPTVKESKERVRSAITNSGLAFPMRRITLNLSPADTRKEGSHFDLPMAVSILAAASLIDTEGYENTAFFGELSLDGGLRKSEIGVALALGLREQGIDKIFLPEGNLAELSLVDGVEFYAAESLRSIVDHLNGSLPIKPAVFQGVGNALESAPDMTGGDFAEVKGQERAKRALQICAAGGHDIALMGPPGAGKSMLASRIMSILPPPTKEEALEITKIYNIAGTVRDKNRLITVRPFRAPHHSISYAALIGGGIKPIPGELSLAHRGVLFLDELPEFERRTLDMLRQPMEDGYIDLSRVSYRNTYPCNFIFIAAMNPCPCGYYGDPEHECRCNETMRRKYIGRVSGPLLDRIDLHLDIERVRYSELADGRPSLSSAELYEGVKRARSRQLERYGERNGMPVLNGDADAFEASKSAEDFPNDGGDNGNGGDSMAGDFGMAPEAEEALRAAHQAFGISARQSVKMKRVARTIADIEGSGRILAVHMAEALSYRRKDKE
ncbi:MAG: YifB family Mg chelatase-like AAA ATPase [Clostridiales Family XIII bacterium]|jgi:magnesium chelatase family protein|nr:YifB family Mg chelatase-like AAA ATPase [Clostridiales Family XIII bacterium]